MPFFFFFPSSSEYAGDGDRDDPDDPPEENEDTERDRERDRDRERLLFLILLLLVVLLVVFFGGDRDRERRRGGDRDREREGVRRLCRLDFLSLSTGERLRSRLLPNSSRPGEPMGDEEERGRRRAVKCASVQRSLSWVCRAVEGWHEEQAKL